MRGRGWGFVRMEGGICTGHDARMPDLFTTVFVLAPVAGVDGDQWVVTRDGRVLKRCTGRREAWRAALGPAHDASVVHDQRALVLERDARGRVVRHMELGSPAR